MLLACCLGFYGVCSSSISLVVLPAVAQMIIVDAVARMNCEPALDTDER